MPSSSRSSVGKAAGPSGRNLQKLQKARGNLFLVNQSVPSILISSKEV